MTKREVFVKDVVIDLQYGDLNSSSSFPQSILSLEYCIGIIGGKPKQAYYFVGFQG